MSSSSRSTCTADAYTSSFNRVGSSAAASPDRNDTETASALALSVANR